MGGGVSLIVVDHRARLNVELLRTLVDEFDVQQAVEAIKASTTYANPQKRSTEGMLRGARGAKAHALAAALRLMDDEVCTWHDDGQELSVPRGALSKIVDALAERCGIAEPSITEKFTRGDPRLEWPARDLVHRPDPKDETGVLRWYQEEAIAAVLRSKAGIIRAPTGCLAGETLVGINRAGKGSTMRLDHVVKMFNGGWAGGKKWDPSIETFVRAPMSDGTVRLARILSGTESGKRPVYRVRLAQYLRGPVGRGGKERWVKPEVLATTCHRFMTPFGWKRLDELDVGDTVFVDGGLETKGDRPAVWDPYRKPWYKLRTCRAHPYVGRKGVNPAKGGWTVAEHRLVAEARENRMSLSEFLRAVDERRPGLKFLNPKTWVVHHIDGNPRNNRMENLRVVTHAEHRQEHEKGSTKNITSKLRAVTIASVEYAGVVPTYDLEVERAEAFMANGVAVHNSGKTSMAIGLVNRVRVPSLIVVWSSSLMRQWHQRLKSELGLHELEIGLIGDGHNSVRAVTVGLQQSLVKRHDLRSKFGLVLCDEVQRFAARTFVEVVDHFDAEYRVGVSADETRRDGQEPIIYDVFGPIRHETAQKTLVEEGAVIDVKCRVVPTEYSAPWYVAAVKAKRMPDTHRLDEEQANATARTEIGLEIARALVAKGEQVLFWTKRVSHSETIVAELGKEMPTELVIGGVANRARFERGVAGLRDGSIKAVAGTLQAVSTGNDIPALSRGILMVSIGKNRQLFGQLKGRLCRPGKEEAVIYVLWDRKVYGAQFLERMVAWNTVCEVLSDGGQWVNGKDYLKAYKENHDDDPTNG